MTDSPAAPYPNARTVALVEDDADLAAATAQLLRLEGLMVERFDHAEAALAAIDADWPGVVVSDVRMPGMSGVELQRRLAATDAALPVILVTGHGDVDMAVAALKAGAWDFLTKPFAAEALIAAVARAVRARALALDNRRLQAEAAGGARADEGPAAALIGSSPAIRRLRAMIPTLADADLDILIEGETGTGKELVARLIHQAGKRRRHRFMALGCAGMDAALENELFSPGGGASLVHASRGTLLLDDLDRAGARFQDRLVALLEDRALAAPGRAPLPLDLRVVATIGVQAGSAGGGAGALAPALLHRIAGMRLTVPPLRERREDVPALFAHFVGVAAARNRVAVPALTPEVRARLDGHDWPGNAHELARHAERFVLGLLADTPAQPAAADLPSLEARVDAFEREAIIAALRAAGGKVAPALESLGLARKTFYYKVKRLGIDLAAVRG